MAAPPPQRPGSQQRTGPLASSAFDPVQPESQKVVDAVRMEDLLRETSEVEEAVEVLKVRYDQWLMGYERREPSREREELKRTVARLKTTLTRNAGLRFRIQSLHARFISYERMWQRSAREKEEGTYRRDVLRARRAAERAKREEAGGQAPAATPTPAPTATATTTPTAPVRPEPFDRLRAGGVEGREKASPVPGMTDAELRTLHAAYVEARRSCNEDTARFTVDALARTLAKQVPELMERYKAKRVEFRVTVKDGKTVLKAVPKT